jgi:energy-converting hydrogenase Eha subunit E
MASAFSITTPTNAITLDAERKALIVFTVSNQLGRSVRVRTSVSPFEPTPAGWFKIEGESERLFPPGGSEAFTVRVTAPPEAEPGQNAFRLDAVSADKPDDEWAHGPTIGFQVPEPPKPPPPPEPSKGYLETLLGALAGTVLALILVTISNVIVLSLLGVNVANMGSSLRILLFGEVLALTAVGAIGAVTGLIIRAVPEPAPWRTGLAFGVLATLILTIVNAILIKAIALFPDTGVGLIVTIVATLVIVIVVALISRLIGRLMSAGKP